MTQLSLKSGWSYALILALVAALVSFWQATHIWPMIDYSYQMEGAYRIYLGQIPFKNFGLVVMPGTYYLMALLMKLFGVSNLVFVFYIIFLQGGTLLLTFFLLNRIHPDYLLNLLFLIPLIFSGHGIYPFPSYDIHTLFFMLLALSFLTRIIDRKKRGGFFVLAGFFISLPVFFKQNTGLVFSGFLLLLLFLDSFGMGKNLLLKDFFLILTGWLILPVSFCVWLVKIGAWNTFFIHIFTYPNRMRPAIGSIPEILTSYGSKQALVGYFFLGSVVLLFRWVRGKKSGSYLMVLSSIFFLLLIPFILVKLSPDSSQSFTYQLYRWLEYPFGLWYGMVAVTFFIFLKEVFKKKDQSFFWKGFPLLCLLVTNASFLSQGMMGSTYGLWPFFFLMGAFILKQEENLFPSLKKIFVPVTAILTLCLALYIFHQLRLTGYINYRGPLEKASYPGLKGLATRGSWIKNFESLLAYVKKEIPPLDLIINIPGEDPFYSMSLRKPPLPYIQVNDYTMIPPAEWMIQEGMKKGVKWIIVKDPLQSPKGYKRLDILFELLKKYYAEYHSLPGYKIYHYEGESRFMSPLHHIPGHQANKG